MIRVTHVISSLTTGGSEMMLYKLLRDMNRSQIDNRVVCMIGGGPIADMVRALGITVEDLGMRRGLPDPRALWRLRRILRRDRPDVLQTWLYHADLLGVVAGRWAGVPSIAWNIRCSAAEARYREGGANWTVQLLARLSSLPEVVVSNSQAGIEFHRALGYHPRRWELVPNGFDLDTFRPLPEARRALRAELGLTPDTLIVGLVARFDPLKDHETFLRAVKILAGQMTGVHFVLVGREVTPDNPFFAQLVAGLGLDRVVHLLGERNDIPRITAGLDVATCSSIAEGFPNVLGEAMACAVPVVATDVGDVRIVAGKAAVVVAPSDPAALARGWHTVLSLNQPARSAMGALGRERIAASYALAGIARQYEDLYSELAKNVQERAA